MWNAVSKFIRKLRLLRAQRQRGFLRNKILRVEILEDRMVLAPGNITLKPLGSDGIIITGQSEQNTIFIGTQIKGNDLVPMARDTYRWDVKSEQEKQQLVG